MNPRFEQDKSVKVISTPKPTPRNSGIMEYTMADQAAFAQMVANLQAAGVSFEVKRGSWSTSIIIH